MSWKILIKQFALVLMTTSPVFREALREFVKSLYVKAISTDNPFDDFFVEFLASLLKLEVTEEKVK